MSVDDGSLGRKENFKKKTLSADDGSLGRKKKKKKTMSVDDGSLGRKKKRKEKKEVLSVEVSKPASQDLGFRTSHRRTDRLRLFISSIDRYEWVHMATCRFSL
jgi:hypothetical protein